MHLKIKKRGIEDVWKEPRLVLDGVAQLYWQMLKTRQTLTQSYPKRTWEYPDSLRGHALMERAFHEINRFYSNGHSGEEMPNKFRRKFNQLCIDLATEFEKKNEHSIVASLIDASEELEIFAPNLADAAMFVTIAIRVLLGNERHLMVGSRQGKPAFLNLRKPVKTYVTPSGGTFLTYGLGMEMRYIDQSDTAVLPDPEEWLPGISRIYQWPIVSREKTQELLEDAYYNQRYMVHPEGAYVRLRHFGPIVGLTLKVKAPALNDPNYSDFLVILEVDTSKINQINFSATSLTKKSVIVTDGAFASGVGRFFDPENDSTVGSLYFNWLTALIYHDLVTAKEVRGSETAEAGDSLLTSVHPQQPSWTYIPRKVKRKVLPPRLPLTGVRTLIPHHVRGHLRKANPSDEHMKELRKFEQETGFQVLNLLKMRPGYTFVRPFVSPSTENIKGLPKFIHARLQSEINQMLSANNT